MDAIGKFLLGEYWPDFHFCENKAIVDTPERCPVDPVST